MYNVAVSLAEVPLLQAKVQARALRLAGSKLAFASKAGDA
jgi:hypothetical protein